MASQWFVVARREFLERFRTKWFAIITVIGPIGMIALIVLPAYLADQQAEQRTVIDVVDRSGRDLAPLMNEFSAVLGGKLEARAVALDTSEEVLRGRIRDQQIAGYLLVPPDVLTGGEVRYRGDNATNLGFGQKLRVALSGAAIRLRARDSGLDEAKVLALQQPVELDVKQTTGEGAERSAVGSYLLGYVIGFILYMAILLYAMNVGRSVVLEKTSRVVELIVSAVKPRALMIGKVVGVGSVGLLQLAIWGLAALLLFYFRDSVLGAFGIHDVGRLDLPEVGVGGFALLLAYFLLGFFFFAAIYAAIGAMVNSDQEAQQAQMPVTLLLVVPMVCAQAVAGDPRGTAAQILTLLPFSSPVLMPMRYLLEGASGLEIAASLAILVASTGGIVVLAARIYRVGILMHGKRPTLGELGRWLTSK